MTNDVRAWCQQVWLTLCGTYLVLYNGIMILKYASFVTLSQ